jgi:hypothetical protein
LSGSNLKAPGFAGGYLLVLMIAGYLLVNTMVTARRDSQDCYRPGGSNCAAGYTPSRQRG